LSKGAVTIIGVLLIAFVGAMFGYTSHIAALSAIIGLILLPGSALASLIIASGPSGGILFLSVMFFANVFVYIMTWFVIVRAFYIFRSTQGTR
jgi:membrane-bound ClpP family serine protease